VWETFRGFWAPPEISGEAYSFWVQMMADIAESPEWAASLESRGLGVRYIGGEEFEEHIYAQVSDMRELSQRFGFDLSPGS